MAEQTSIATERALGLTSADAAQHLRHFGPNEPAPRSTTEHSYSSCRCSSSR
ncbi:MAG: cation-transporting P-type ATPase [Thermomicrobium sp.]